MSKRPRLLVVGFGPFPRVPRNPSAVAARRVATSPRWRILGIAADALVLPTTYSALDAVLDPTLEAQGFDALLIIGVASRAKKIRVERRAVNRASILFSDAAGRTPARLTMAQAPASRTARMAPAPVLATLRRRRLACTDSQDAGRYLCNAAYMPALAAPVPVLFIHIPKPPRAMRPIASRRKRRVSWQDRLTAGLADVALDLLRRRPFTLGVSREGFLGIYSHQVTSLPGQRPSGPNLAHLDPVPVRERPPCERIDDRLLLIVERQEASD